MRTTRSALAISVLLTFVFVCAAAPPEAGTTSKICGIKFVWCPAGSFTMGRYAGESASYTSEDPAHTVTFAKGFWISKYEITQSQWKAVMGFNPSFHQGNAYPEAANQPVENVSWNGAQEFVAEMNAQHPKRTFRLPSEAEWEYACRAGAATRYYWGDDLSVKKIKNFAWYQVNSDSKPHVVGEKRPNAWKIFDTSGNVWEWVQDSWHETYVGAPVDGSAWEGKAVTYRTVRGGSWYNNAAVCRSAFRAGQDPNGVFGDYGFRLVVEK